MSSNNSNRNSNEPLIGTEETPLDPNSSSSLTTRADTIRSVSNLAAYVANVVVTFGLGMWLDWPSNGELSRKYQSLVTPAGWAFAIWGIIFLAQLAWVVAPFVSLLLRSTTSATTTSTTAIESCRRVGFQYCGIVAAQSAWTVLFSQEQILASAVAMTVLLVLLGRTVQSLTATTTTTISISTTGHYYFLYMFPLTIHAGWIVAATAVNWNVVLVSLRASSAVQLAAALVSLVALLAVAFHVRWYHKMDTTIPWVLVWALLGVFMELKQPQESIATTFEDWQIQVAQWGAAVEGVVIVALIFLVKPQTHQMSS